MNIDIRNIDSKFEAYLTDIMDKYDIRTASKALRFITVNFTDKVNKLEDLYEIRDELKRELYDKKNEVKKIKDAWETLQNLTGK